jgi:apolipoprotein N-acyltransferase
MPHGRLAPIRAAEYGIPVFGVWSSGVSQLTDRYGRIIATAGCPGQGEMIAGPFDLQAAGRLPPDRLLAEAAMIGTALFIAFLIGSELADRATIAPHFSASAINHSTSAVTTTTPS